ncbi:unnamed protein product [Larinioides sclopetarius]|uniref:Uncharacterized protein n=1 Tax=Larinioides sclopetarius TaxID=280406 RepID=A0AAV2A7U2_9ARAC
MLRYLMLCRLAIWLTISCISIEVTQAGILKYGMRLQPPSNSGPLQKQQIVFNKTLNAKTGVQDIPSKVNVQTAVRGGGNNASYLVKESNTKNKNSEAIKPLITSQQATLINSELPKDNSKRPATFFFTQVEPHRFEYRAMFQHHGQIPSSVFQPFVHDFEGFGKDFPPLPKFPTFPELPDFFPEHKDPFPNFHHSPFPTIPPPELKRHWQPPIVPIPPRPTVDENFEGPLKNYDVVLGHTRYPKIFRFNEERVNIEDFDREKKLRFYRLGRKEQNELSEPENVKRDQLLILHGGIFTVQEPPLFNKHRLVKKRRKPGGFGLHRPRI